MDTRWQRISTLFEAALARDAAERLQFVRDSSSDDPEVGRAVESMLAEMDRPQFIDRPALQSVGDLLAAETLLGTQVGPYRIESLLGAGGMGEVYRATDTVLGRHVAIKMLPATLAQDPDRLARFQREARLLAALNHPNISAIYGAEALPGHAARALVLELVEGPTLADKLKPGRLSVDESIAIARQIVDALEAAHRQGIVHRDLKPSNIKITPDGTVKVLDFGLAKLTQRDGDATSMDATVSPTITAPHLLTGAGMLLGTAAYMSPEQAKAREADQRSDVWAFGCVLFEMLSGRRAFDGEDAAEVLGAVVRLEPDWSALPADVPKPLRTLIEECLVKERRRRIGDISTARFVLDHMSTLAPQPASGDGGKAGPSISGYLVGALVVALLASVAVAIGLWRSGRPATPALSRFSFSPTGSAAVNVDPVSSDVAILPGHLVYIARGAAGTGLRLLVRALDQLEPRAIATAGSPRAPFASPDGKSIGFVSLGSGGPTLRAVALAGGVASTLCRIDGQSRGATWSPDGYIIFGTSHVETGLQRVPASGGTPEVLTTPDTSKGELDHLWPRVLPDGRAVLFTVLPAQGGVDQSHIWALDLRTRRKTLVLAGGSQAQYVESGHLVFVRGGSLHAIRFDPGRLETSGQPQVVVNGVAILSNGTAEFDVSSDGTLAYIPTLQPENQVRTMVLVDRAGGEDPVPGASARAYIAPRFSPSGDQIVVDSRDEDNDIWIFDRVRKTSTQLTFGPDVERSPIWTPRGDRIIYTAQATNGLSLGIPFSRAADGTGKPEPIVDLVKDTDFILASSTSPDGALVAGWSVSGPTNTNDLMLVDLKVRRSRQIIPSVSTERNAAISPDGRWMAFESDRDRGRLGVYIVPFPDVGRALYRISDGAGGIQPAWAPNGKELFYVGLDQMMRSVPVDGVTWPAGSPQPLFAVNYFLGSGVSSRAYDVSRDGRFLMLKEAAPAQLVAPASIVIAQNWTGELRRLPTD
jgi:serine/threonine protein kinase/Tol biopolymer transport system component